MSTLLWSSDSGWVHDNKYDAIRLIIESNGTPEEKLRAISEVLPS